MRITFLVENSSTSTESVASVSALVEALKARGHSVAVVSSAPCSIMAYPFAGTTTHSPDFEPAEIPTAEVLVATSWTCVLPALRSKRGAVVHLSYPDDSDSGDSPAQVATTYRNQATHLVAVGPGARRAESLSEQFDRKVHPIPCAIDGDLMYAAGPRPPAQPLRVGIPAPTSADTDDFRLGLTAANLARKAGLELELVCCASEPTSASAFQNSAVQIEWHEQQTTAQRGEVYRTLDVFLDPSTNTDASAPSPALEAMACGVPCVLSEVPSNQDLSPLQYALLVPHSDPSQMAEALVIAGSHRAVREELSTNGIQTASHYSFAAQAEELESIFARVTARDGRSQARLSPVQATQVATPPPTLMPSKARDASTTHGGSEAAEAIRALRKSFDACMDLASFDAVSTRITRQLQAEIAHQRGLVLYALGDIDAALASLRTALEDGLDVAEIHNDYGVALYASGCADEAQRSFRRALEFRPDHAEAGANLDDCVAATRATAN